MIVTGKKQAKRSKKSAGAGFKVVYISSPMKVKTSASKFRSLVQKLTGQDSDAERFMEMASGGSDGNGEWWASASFVDHQVMGEEDVMVGGKVEAGVGGVSPLDELAFLQNLDGNYAEMLNGFWHDSSTAESEMPGLSALL
ncbi:uncharacterized protein LOC101217123 [Cucumis sativus]|uniref:VQ domain-containing protein n=1 Tax=Cucumis sativus TaxID=3659 RepID=A0A0A0KTR9_CUCSA|nr:uncharacterized protein LOC101217123 [Cucumis sativus]WEG77282.1 sigma factor-binding protein 1 [Cucumis sativus var. sativus]